MRSGAHVNRFWSLAVHVQTDPVFTGFNIGTRITQLGYDEMRDPLDAMAEAEKEIKAFYQAVEQRPAMSVADEFGPFFEQLRQDMGKSGLTGVPTGLTRLNDFTGGWQGGDLIILAGRPSMGKTTFAMNLVENAVLRSEKAVLVYSLEMPGDSLIMRMLSSLGRIDQTKVRSAAWTTTIGRG